MALVLAIFAGGLAAWTAGLIMGPCARRELPAQFAAGTLGALVAGRIFALIRSGPQPLNEGAWVTDSLLAMLFGAFLLVGLIRLLPDTVLAQESRGR